MEYEYTVAGLLSKHPEQITQQIQMAREGWDITLSRAGFSAHKTFGEEQDAEELKQEVREILSQYLRALGFEIGVNIGLAPSGSVQVRKPDHTTLTIHEVAHTASAMIVAGPGTLPAVEHLHQLVDTCSTDPLVKYVIDIYLEACEAKRDPDIAIPLYKTWEAMKSAFDGEEQMAQVLGICDSDVLRQNLNWHRHWEEKFEPPKKQLSMAECKERMKQVIDSFIDSRSRQA